MCRDSERLFFSAVIAAVENERGRSGNGDFVDLKGVCALGRRRDLKRIDTQAVDRTVPIRAVFHIDNIGHKLVGRGLLGDRGTQMRLPRRIDGADKEYLEFFGAGRALRNVMTHFDNDIAQRIGVKRQICVIQPCVRLCRIKRDLIHTVRHRRSAAVHDVPALLGVILKVKHRDR